MLDSGRMKFLPFFYAFNHPIYQEVEYRDLQYRVSYPGNIYEFMKSNSCFSTSTDLNHQGGDFCLENKIKRHKMVAPKGIINNNIWRTISRGLDKIEKIQHHGEQMVGAGNSNRYTDTELYHEIVTWRAVLRSSGMLQKDEEEGIIKNIYGELLSPDSDDFTCKLESKMQEYWDIVALGTPLQHIKYKKTWCYSRQR